MLRSDSGVTRPQDAPDIAVLRAKVRSDLASVLKPRAPSTEDAPASHVYDVAEARDYMATLQRLGYAAPHWPREHGGMGASDEVAELIDEELANFEAPNLYPFFVALHPASAGIIAHGTPEQQGRWLPPILRGEEIWCQLFSEPDAGSDLAGVRTTAVRDGSSWRINGSKTWSSRASYARWGYMLARTDPDVAKHAGLTMFAVDMSHPGIVNIPIRQMNGEDSNFSQIFLEDIVISDDDRIGAVGEGWKVVGSSLRAERTAARSSMGFSLERIVQHASADDVRENPVARDRMARLVTLFKIGQWTAERARAAAVAGRDGPSASQAKVQTSRLMIELGRTAVDLRGVADLAWEGAPSPWLTDFLTSPASSIRGGTDEIQRNIIGERDLGLPRERRS